MDCYKKSSRRNAVIEPWFRKFAGSPTDANATRTLSDVIKPPITLRMTTVGGELEAIQDDSYDNFPKRACYGIPMDHFPSDIPIFQLSDIDLLEVLKSDVVFKVCVEGVVLCAKIVVQQSHRRPIQREMNTLLRIQAEKKSHRLGVLIL